jgi:hypothetical protein
MNFHEFTNGGKEVLILKRIPQSRVTNGGGKGQDLVWPGVGSKVECDQWNPAPKCVGGIHGWPWGFGLGDGMEYDVAGDVWLVIGADPADVVGNVNNGAKCKVRAAIVRFEGTFTDAMKFVAVGFRSCVEAWANTHVADGSSGDSAKIGSSGDYAQIGSSGDSAKIGSSGDYAQIGSSGDYAQIGSSGYSAQIGSSGYSAKITASGKDCIVTVAAVDCRVRMGERGAFAIPYWDEDTGWEFLTGKVGRDGILANTWYKVEDGKLVADSKFMAAKS